MHMLSGSFLVNRSIPESNLGRFRKFNSFLFAFNSEKWNNLIWLKCVTIISSMS